MLRRLFVKLKKTSIINDFILNIISSFILTFATQLIAYPYLSRIMSIEQYGRVLTIMGVLNASAVAFGNSLNNTKILVQSEYEEKKLTGDFNPLFLLVLCINSLLVIFLSKIIYTTSINQILGYIVISNLILFRSYYTVDYRIVINYKKNLYVSVVGFIGYILGIIVCYYTKKWIMIFLLGELFSCIYIYFTAKIVKEKYRLTTLFKSSATKYILIMSGAILSTLIMYMDRFFIYPMLGAQQVSVYNVASFIGKTAGIIFVPITGVLLTYYAKESSITLKNFFLRTGIFAIISALLYIVIIFLGSPLVNFFYPTLINQALPYFWIANLAAIMFVFGNTIQPTLLRFCSMKWQPIIQGSYLLLYLLMGFIGMKNNGLMGFCFSVLFVNLYKIIIMVVVVTISLLKKEKREKGLYVSN